MAELISPLQAPRPVDMDNFFRDDGNGAGNHLGDTINGRNQEVAAAAAARKTTQQVFESVLTKPEFHELADEFEFVTGRGADGEIHRHWQSIDPARRGHDPYEQVEQSTIERWRRQLLRHEEPEPFIFTNHNGDLASKHPDMSVVRKMVAQHTQDLMAHGVPQPIPVQRSAGTGTMRVRPREYGSAYESRVPAPAARVVGNVVAGTVVSSKVSQSGQHRRVKQLA